MLRPRVVRRKCYQSVVAADPDVCVALSHSAAFNDENIRDYILRDPLLNSARRSIWYIPHSCKYTCMNTIFFAYILRSYIL